MKLLFVTQVLDRDDAVLGFVMRWVQGLAGQVESLRVLALEVGNVEGLPGNVDVREIGRRGYVRRFLRYRRYLRESFRSGPNGGFDGLLTHMVPRYSTLAAGPAAKAMGGKGAAHFLWYTHKGVDRRLLSALEVVDGAFTASDLSLRVDTPKKIVTGHGIDLDHFDVPPVGEFEDGRIQLLSVGRLTPAKDPLTTLEAVSHLRDEGLDVRLTWAGSPLARGDDDYEAMVHRAVSGRDLDGVVEFVGAVPYPRIPQMFGAADLFVNASRTGSVDKVVLESMAARRPFVSCNESIPPVLAADSELATRAGDYAFQSGDSISLASALRVWIDRSADDRRASGERLREIVARHHEVDALMARIVRRMEER
ncbi:D-inositol-3-phosphate glycosyltransferase [Planctomycetes bacterium Poly30]|uniref:D-inositol-3-phosphate glycosyltransferase n=1 Tax=Saltatorellus ferox TaxID=2528018 RepID=A0A518ERS6_9BACT|nr:D-inositol-3-phosphate glycosyltransferase [Planctomycetes bacterium Poly30]